MLAEQGDSFAYELIIIIIMVGAGVVVTPEPDLYNLDTYFERLNYFSSLNTPKMGISRRFKN